MASKSAWSSEANGKEAQWPVPETPAPTKEEWESAEHPPLVALTGIKFLKEQPTFTKQALQEHGYVWKALILGKTVYGIGGAEGLKKFYDPANISRWGAATKALFDCVWANDGSYAIPPLDGDKWWKRKNNLMTATTPKFASQYLKMFDAKIVETFQTMGSEGEHFVFWDIINRLVLVHLSKAHFGFGFDDWEGGTRTDAAIHAVQDNFTIVGDNLPIYMRQVAAKNLLFEYLQAALDQVRNNPDKYADSGLATFLKTDLSKTLNDDEIKLDMVQLLIVGTYGLCTQTPPMLYTLLKNPDIKDAIAKELKEKFKEPASPDSLKALPYTFAFVKEVLRYWPAVFAVAGQAKRDIVHDGKKIPKDAKVLATLYATCHDPAVFKDPESFDVTRFLPPRNEGGDEVWNGYQVAFGAGNPTVGHSCGGRHIALAFLLLFAVRLVQNFRWEMVDPDEEIKFPRAEPHAEYGLLLQVANNSAANSKH